MTERKTYLRNIFAIEDETDEWREVLSAFPNKVPRFSTKQEADLFVKLHCSVIHSNPEHPGLQHSISTLIDWQQIERFLIPKIREYKSKWTPILPEMVDKASNLYLNREITPEKSVYNHIISRLNLSVHREMTDLSTMNTLKYMFFHMKCGIYVMIRDNRVVIFCPFVNKDYRNSWNGSLKLKSRDGSLESYSSEKQLYSRQQESYLPDMDTWWANGNIICNAYRSDENDNQYWGDHFLLQLKDMFAEACNARVIPDCDFFINKRDYPQLKFNGMIAGGIPVEPYGFVFDRDDRDPSQDLPLNRHFYASYAPIL